MAHPIEGVLHKAGAARWCSKPNCTTCGSTEFRTALDTVADQNLSAFAEWLGSMDLSAWYAVEDVGGAVGIAFSLLSPQPPLIASVLAAWQPRIAGHTRLIDAVMFHVVRRGIAPADAAVQWTAVARSEAIASRDPSLLETMVYALGSRVADDLALLAAAKEQRRGYAPLHRALSRTLGTLAREA